MDAALTGVERTRPESQVMSLRSLLSRMDSAEAVALRIGRYLYFSFPIPALAEVYTGAPPLRPLGGCVMQVTPSM